jgi:hypothetical protein
MDKLKFSDGMEVVVSGPYRVTHLRDGYYVVGHGVMVAANSRGEANDLCNDLRRQKEREVDHE